MFSPEVLSRYQAQGYVVVKGLFSEEHVNRLHNLLLRNAAHCFADELADYELRHLHEADFHQHLLEARDRSPKDFSRLFDTLQTSASLQAFCLSDAVLPVVSGLLQVDEAALTCHTPQLRMDAPGNNRNSLGYHQDCAYHGQNAQGVNALVMWTPLLTANPTLGDLCILPDSHQEGVLDATRRKQGEFHSTNYDVPPSTVANYTEQRLQLAQGDCVFFNMNLIHRSAPNDTEFFRFTAQARFHNAFSADFRQGRLVYKMSA